MSALQFYVLVSRERIKAFWVVKFVRCSLKCKSNIFGMEIVLNAPLCSAHSTEQMCFRSLSCGMWNRMGFIKCCILPFYDGKPTNHSDTNYIKREKVICYYMWPTYPSIISLMIINGYLSVNFFLILILCTDAAGKSAQCSMKSHSCPRLVQVVLTLNHSNPCACQC